MSPSPPPAFSSSSSRGMPRLGWEGAAPARRDSRVGGVPAAHHPLPPLCRPNCPKCGEVAPGDLPVHSGGAEAPGVDAVLPRGSPRPAEQGGHHAGSGSCPGCPSATAARGWHCTREHPGVPSLPRAVGRWEDRGLGRQPALKDVPAVPTELRGHVAAVLAADLQRHPVRGGVRQAHRWLHGALPERPNHPPQSR